VIEIVLGAMGGRKRKRKRSIQGKRVGS